MEQYTSEEARKKWRRILNTVENGGQVEVTRYGKPLAAVVPVEQRDKPMKLYIWEDVLRDYSAGMIVAIAPDLETALATADSDSVREEMGRVTPTVIEIDGSTTPQSWHVWGGA